MTANTANRSFVSYINERLGGYEVDTRTGPRNQWLSSREGRSFPEFYAQTHPASTHTHDLYRPDHLQRPRAAQTRHRQSQGGAERRRIRRSLYARNLAVEHRRLAEERL